MLIFSGVRGMLLADIALVSVSLFWGLGFVAMKDALASFPPFWLLSIRFGAASVLLLLIFRRKVRAMTRNDLIAGVVIGIFLFLGFATQTIGLNFTTAGKQAFLTSVYVIMTPFLSWFIRRVFPGILVFVSAAVCIFGMAFLTLQEGFQIGFGDTLTLVCALFFAAQLVAIEHYAPMHDPVTLTIVQICTVLVLSLLCAPLFETWPGFDGSNGIGSIAYTVLFCTIFAFLIQNTAQKHTSSTHAAILLSLESLFGALSGVFLLGEVFTSRMIFGCALIFVAVLLTELGNSVLLAFRKRRDDSLKTAGSNANP
jgi:drug/metabolite transporter (DMT)-like permease